MHSRQKQSPLLELFSGLDYVTLLTAMVGSLYGLALVYSATHSALKDGKIISSDVRSMFLSVALGVVICLLVSNVNYEAVAKLWPGDRRRVRRFDDLHFFLWHCAGCPAGRPQLDRPEGADFPVL